MEVLQFISLIIYVGVVIFMIYGQKRTQKQRDFYKKKLDDLAKKSQLEQDLELATTDQLMKEVASRVPGFILLMPSPCNAENVQPMAIHIKGMPPHVATMFMSMAIQVINNGQPLNHVPQDEDV